MSSHSQPCQGTSLFFQEPPSRLFQSGRRLLRIGEGGHFTLPFLMIPSRYGAWRPLAEVAFVAEISAVTVVVTVRSRFGHGGLTR
jgi:hypothetical protein